MGSKSTRCMCSGGEAGAWVMVSTVHARLLGPRWESVDQAVDQGGIAKKPLTHQPPTQPSKMASGSFSGCSERPTRKSKSHPRSACRTRSTYMAA